MIPNHRATSILQGLEQHSQKKQAWLNLWQEIADLVHPHRSFFTDTTAGQQQSNKIHDGTAPYALEQFAAGLHGHLTSPTQRFFTLIPKNRDLVNKRPVKKYLDEATNLMYSLVFSNPGTFFNQQIHQLYLDIGAFGTSCMFLDESDSIRFMAFPLKDITVAENHRGVVDTVYREFKFTVRQIMQKFPDSAPESVSRLIDKEPNREFDIVHVVFPRDDRKLDSPKATDMPFASVYILKEEKIILSESGFNEMPYMVPRWSKMVNEVYGRSPAMMCLPDIKMINSMAKTVIRAAQKATDPPLLVPNDGFMLPIRTSPNSLIYYDPTSLMGDQGLQALDSKSRPDIGLEMMDQRREHIMRCFFVDWMQLQKEKVEMTATEVVQRTEERMRLMSPMVGRLQAELLGPIIERTFAILDRKGMLPEPPEELLDEDLEIDYVSPVARAQKMTQAMGVTRALQDLAPLAEQKPQMFDRLDEDEFTKWMFELNDAPERIINTDDAVQQIREARAQAAQKEESQQDQLVQAETANKMAPLVKQK